MRVAIVGAGLIGASWAALFAARGGAMVTAWDPDPAARARFDERLAHARRQLMELDADVGGVVRVVDTLGDCLEGADWIQENAPEKVELKQGLLAEIEGLAPLGAPIASSTSSLLWSDLARLMRNPDRLLLAHPFNPPHLVPLVEVFARDEALAERAMALYRSLGHAPIRLRKEAVGHVANRLASALWREAVNIVDQGIASVEDVDAALVNGPGLRWSLIGAHMAYHLGGGDGGLRSYLDHLGASQVRRWADLGNPQLTPDLCDELVAGVEREAAGRDIAALEADRDRRLIEVLRLRAAGAAT